MDLTQNFKWMEFDLTTSATRDSRNRVRDSARIFTWDRDTPLMILNLKMEQRDGTVIEYDLTNMEGVILDFHFRHADARMTLWTDEIHYIDRSKGQVGVILPNQFQYRGQVDIFVYVSEVYKERSFDVGHISLSFDESSLDKDLPELHAFYNSRIEDIIEEFLQRAGDAIEAIEGDIRGIVEEVVVDKLDGMDIQGEPGADGQDGLSAFEIAVQQGFIGTESEWLESLRGADGIDGQNANYETVQQMIDEAINVIDFPDGFDEERVREIVLEEIGNIEVPDLDEERVQELINIAVVNFVTQDDLDEFVTHEQLDERLEGISPDVFWTDVLGRPTDFTNLAIQSELNPDTFIVMNTDVTQHSAHGTQWIRTGGTTAMWAQLMLTQFTMSLSVGDVFRIQFQGFREGAWPVGTRLLMRYIYTDNTSSEALNWGTIPINTNVTTIDTEITVHHAPDPNRQLSHINLFLQRDNSGTGFINIRELRVQRKFDSSNIQWEHGTPVVNLPNNFVVDASIPITAYPDGRSVHFLSANPATSNFPFGTVEIETGHYGTAGIQTITNLMNGAVQKRIWSGISWQSWVTFDSIGLVEKLCEKLGVDFEELMEEVE